MKCILSYLLLYVLFVYFILFQIDQLRLKMIVAFSSMFYLRQCFNVYASSQDAMQVKCTETPLHLRRQSSADKFLFKQYQYAKHSGETGNQTCVVPDLIREYSNHYREVLIYKTEMFRLPYGERVDPMEEKRQARENTINSVITFCVLCVAIRIGML